MHRKSEELVCDVCGKDGARVIQLYKSYGKGNDLLVIENVLVVSCPHCGEVT
jgi:YgiT-type zinc finger domain-containing protein